jgi:hypothetical protein
MITNKDIRVENGYLIINGDKYPLDGQSPEAIMAIVKDNSDTTPTENSDAPITSGGVYTALGNVIKSIEVNVTSSTSGHANPVHSAGGAYYEALIDYTTLGVTKDKIISVEIVNWDSIKKAFNLYLGGTTISAISDSSDSIYNVGASFVDLRVTYRE